MANTIKHWQELTSEELLEHIKELLVLRKVLYDIDSYCRPKFTENQSEHPLFRDLHTSTSPAQDVITTILSEYKLQYLGMIHPELK